MIDINVGELLFILENRVGGLWDSEFYHPEEVKLHLKRIREALEEYERRFEEYQKQEEEIRTKKK